MEPGVLGLRTRPACLSKGMMSSKLRQHNMTRDMTFNIPCSAGADSRFQKMVSMMDTCRAGGACVSSSMIWLVLYCIGSIIARARSSDSPADLQQTEAKLSAEVMSENRRYAPACQCAIGGICHGLMPRARISIASLMCCRSNAGALYLLKSEATSRIMRPFSLAHGTRRGARDVGWGRALRGPRRPGSWSARWPCWPFRC